MTVDVLFEQDNVWLTQTHYGRSVSEGQRRAISEHI